ncbi:hypothetical protein CYLTODRAFT_419368 [Cylindrobasidium torrendii FP15055 ss-10]|uniref:Uncharacterized protein n=1 Tax=Cylindrobasidium torrendii FP15055 ss-10 TaxID=1314674 RepID=A0A0D7BL24_9AGAR|nr:hypothetical protein CYLTODRAFT_419368 [Cylindrobasidium torrendii FP15055 ss-10]
MDSWFGMFIRKIRNNNYEALPNDAEEYELPTTTTAHRSPAQTNNRFSRKPVQVVLRLLASPYFQRGFIIALLIPIAYILSGGVPPSYADIHAYELNLPQHRKPSGDRRYLRFEGTLTGLGLNNILQEHLLLSYIAYAANRSFVFSDYTWSTLPIPYTVDEWALRPTHMPLNTFISGPTAGGDMPSIGLTQDALNEAERSGTPPPHDIRAVHVSFFDSVCPKEQRVTLNSLAQPQLTDESLTGDALLNVWVEYIASVASEPCVVVDFTNKRVFDHLLFGTERVVDMYPLMAATPILKDFKWAPLVQDAVDRNMAGINRPASSQIPGLLAVHLRRGDYFGHCKYLTKWSVRYQGMNRFPGIPDHFDPDDFDEAKQTKYEHFVEHCMPDVPTVVARLGEVRDAAPELGLTKVYAMSNGKRAWLDELWTELRKDGWGPVQSGEPTHELGSTADLDLTNREWYVSGAIDMAIAEQAQMFVGNGWSSLTGNIIMFRLAKGVDIHSNRLL